MQTKATTRWTPAVGEQNLEAPIKFVRHDTPESLVCELWEMTEEELRASEMGVVLLDGTSMSFSYEDSIEAARTSGLWGFFIQATREIHYWMAEDCEPSKFVLFAAHELMHAAKSSKQRASVAEELLCELVGRIASMAFDAMEDVFGKGRKTK